MDPGYEGDPKRAESWYGFGEPVLALADGTVVSVSDIHPDEPIGELGQRPPYGNHIVLEIGDRRYAVLAHLEQGSARVSNGERVRLGQQIAAVATLTFGMHARSETGGSGRRERPPWCHDAGDGEPDVPVGFLNGCVRTAWVSEEGEGSSRSV